MQLLINLSLLLLSGLTQ